MVIDWFRGFEFTYVAAHADQLLDVLAAFFFEPFQVEVLRPCRNFKVAVPPFEFLHAVSAFRIAPGRRFCRWLVAPRGLLCSLLFHLSFSQASSCSLHCYPSK